MKSIIFILLLIFKTSLLFCEEKIKNPSIENFLPKSVSFALYVNKLDRVFSEFKNSYFWKKYKLTWKGKEIDNKLGSINASVFLLGGTFDDLLDIFSQKAVVGVWVNNNRYITNYIYLIEKKKNNKNSINSVIERLEYFAVANKINLTKEKINSFLIYNFAGKLFLGNSDRYVLISPKFNLIKNIIFNIEQNIINNLNFQRCKECLKNKNVIFYFKQKKGIFTKEYYYSLRFRRTPELEVLYKDNNDEYKDLVNYDTKVFKFIPRDVNFIYFAKKDVREIVYPFFDLIGTNYFRLNKSYFNSFFKEFDEKNISFMFPNFLVGKISSKTNFLNIININAQTNLKLFVEPTNIKATYLKVPIYFNNDKYFALIGKYLLVSKQQGFLKRAISAYKTRRSFYYTRDYKKISLYRRKNLVLWMNLKKFLTKEALKYKRDKWAYYNAYIRTFSKMILYSSHKDAYLYLKLFFYNK